MKEPLKKIVILGPESTGKSTLSEGLAKLFGEPWVPEYAREYLEKLKRPYVYEDLLEIARGQIALEDHMANKAQKMLFCDTDLNVIRVWSEHKYKKTPPWILEQLQIRKYDYYLLTDIDIAWEEDPQREHPEPGMRKYFFNWYKKIVEATGVPYALISGDPSTRLAEAAQLIEKQFLGNYR